MKQAHNLVIVFLIITSVTASATIINVPVDQPTIQQGIDASSDGDTVLVQPGIYYENISIDIEHGIFLGSLYMTTGDTSYINLTIIDGNSSGSVIIIPDNYYAPTVNIFGFTIQNGQEQDGGGVNGGTRDLNISFSKIIDNHAVSLGGGIYLHKAYGGTANISYCEIRDNDAYMGGGLFLDFYYHDELTNCLISDNTATYGGGVTFGYTSRLVANNIFKNNTALLDGGGVFAGDIPNTLWPAIDGFHNNLIIFNTAGRYGGGIAVYTEEFWNEYFIEMYSITVAGNSAGVAGGGVYLDQIDGQHLIESIVWGNTAPSESQIHAYCWGYNGYGVWYCDVQGGIEGGWNIINCEPMFCNPVEEDFRLAENSCCLGAGYDGVDIGAFGIGCDSIINEYKAGDANMYNGQWPPTVIGADVTYLANYFRSMPTSQPCNIDGFWGSADINGDCQIIGSDVTRLRNYFLGIMAIEYCPTHPPIWQPGYSTPPVDPPEGWPNCEPR